MNILTSTVTPEPHILLCIIKHTFYNSADTAQFNFV